MALLCSSIGRNKPTAPEKVTILRTLALQKDLKSPLFGQQIIISSHITEEETEARELSHMSKISTGPEVVRGARNLSRNMSLPQHLGATCPVERTTDNTEECAWERNEKNSPTSQGRTEEDREVYNQEADNKVYLSVDVRRRGPASPVRASIGGHLPAATAFKLRLAEAAVISVRPSVSPPPRRVAGACAARSTSLLLSRPRPGGPEREAGTMFRRKLTALDYHNPAGFNCKDETEFRNFIVWLEDQKIRHYKIEDRGNLRNIHSSDWPKFFEKYLRDVNCPFKIQDRQEAIDWLLGLAVRLEYGDNAEKYKDLVPDNSKTADNATKNAEPLINLDVNNPDFKAGVMALANLLQIQRHDDYLVMLKAIRILVQERLTQDAVAKANQTKEGLPVALDKHILGFDTGDAVLNEAAQILRLLHIEELRELQTKINEAIVAVQAIIADPKTDHRLGKVGR
ncbi:hypothetical protein H8959_016380 [Pygathrix nigripes]